MSVGPRSRGSPVVYAIAVVLGSWLAGDVVNAMVTARFWAQAREERGWFDAPKVRVTPPLKHYLDPIVSRNVFANGAPDPELRLRRLDPCFGPLPGPSFALESLAQHVRIVPHFEYGQPRGFKLFSVKSGSTLAKIGFANGDVVREVNGYDVSNPAEAMQVYARVKNEKRFSIELTRGGQKMTLSHAIP